MKLFGDLALGLVLGAAVTGCGPAVSEKDLGKIVFELPKIPGADQPYPLPESGELPSSKPLSEALPSPNSVGHPPKAP